MQARVQRRLWGWNISLVRLVGALLLIVVFALLWQWTLMVMGYVGQGDFATEKLVGNTGVGDSSLVVSMGAGGPTAVGMAPDVSTAGRTAGTNILIGDLTDLNLLPSAEVWFEWNDASGSHTTTRQTVGATGQFSHDITGDSPSGTVNFRGAAKYDGTVYGAWMSYVIPSGAVTTGNTIITNIVPLVIFAICVVAAIKAQSWQLLLTGLVGGLIAYIVAGILIGTL